MKIKIWAPIILALLFVITSCNKNEEIIQPKKAEAGVIKNINLEEKLKAFINKAENPTKSGSTMDIENAMWYIESSLNYGYADAGQDISNLIVDSAFVDIPLTNGGILESEAGTAFTAIRDAMSEQFHAIKAENKYLQSVNIQIIEPELKSGSENIQVKASVVYNAEETNPQSGFGNDDWWFYGMREMNSGGYCAGTYAGTQTDPDAAEQLMNKVHARKPVYSGRTWYEYPIDKWVDPYMFPNHLDTIRDNYQDYLLFDCLYGTNIP